MDMRRALPLLAVLAVSLVSAGSADAAVVNGNFESGTLNGWQVHRATEAGNWFAYEGTEAPLGHKLSGIPIAPPPQGTFAAIADEANPDTLLLYQEVAIPTGATSELSLFAYYNSHVPLAVPTPDTLSVDEEVLAGQANQQFRIDVMRAGAPLESLEPADVLLNVFQTSSGGPQVMNPTKLTADLTPYAGQTVMLRIAVAAHQETLNAGVDAVQITSSGPGAPPGSGGSSGAGGAGGPHGSGGSTGGHGGGSGITLGKPKLNPRNGTVALSVRVPAAGVLRARGTALPGQGSSGAAIRATGAPAKKAGTVVLHLVPTGAAFTALKKRGSLRVKATVSFSPQAEGERSTASKTLVLRLHSRVSPKRSKTTD
jgi:hypothetical protein